MITELQLESIKSITPNQLSRYLSSTDWREDGNIRDIAAIWHRHEKDLYEFEIIQPLRIDLKDYKQRVYDLINLLSEFERREFIDIANDINNSQADIIKIRVVHNDVESGTIPLNDGVLLIEKAKELLLSVAKSTFSKRKYFSGDKLSEELSDVIDSMRLGQTEYGSYVVNIISPIGGQENEQEELIKGSVARAVSDALAKSLNAIDESVEEYKRTQNISSFDAAVEKGVSANLCDALVGLSGESHARDVHITLSLSKAEEVIGDLKLTHTFKTNNIPYLETASDYYKERYVLNNQTVSGLIVKLFHMETEETGTITIDSLVNGAKKNVSVELSIDDYWEAHNAHKKVESVECFGDLYVSPKSAKLLKASNFKVLRNEDIV